MSMREVTVYTRAGCHLCEDACALLARYGLQPKLVDVDAQDELAAQYGASVPVVEIDGKVRFRGRVDETLLVRILRGSGA